MKNYEAVERNFSAGGGIDTVRKMLEARLQIARKGQPMILRASENQEMRHRIRPDLNGGERSSSVPSILIATTDPEIRQIMAELLQSYAINTLWASGMEETKSALANQNVAACFCGFWLVDGTYRDVVRHLKHQYAEIPVIIVCAPKCPHEYRDYLAALNIRAFDFICHPYRRIDLERILGSAIAFRDRDAQTPKSAVNSWGGIFDSSTLPPAS
jgi:CheY-like chemotaxis protein